MAEEIAFENGRISNFEGLVTLTLDQVVLHTVVHHLSTSTYMPNFIKIEETSCGWTYVRTYGNLRPTLLGRLRRVDLIKGTQKTFSQPFYAAMHVSSAQMRLITTDARVTVCYYYFFY